MNAIESKKGKVRLPPSFSAKTAKPLDYTDWPENRQKNRISP
jgi:hypothetical protein